MSCSINYLAGLNSFGAKNRSMGKKYSQKEKLKTKREMSNILMSKEVNYTFDRLAFKYQKFVNFTILSSPEFKHFLIIFIFITLK